MCKILKSLSLAVAVLVLMAPITSEARKMPFTVKGVNVQKAPSCTVAQFTSQVTNFGGVTLVTPIQTNEIGTFATVNMSDNYQIPAINSIGPTVSYNYIYQSAALALQNTATISEAIFNLAVVPANAQTALQAIYDYNTGRVKTVLANNGGCAVFSGVSVPVERYTNAFANYPGLEDRLKIPFVKALMPVGNAKIPLGIVDILFNSTYIDPEVQSRMALGIAIGMPGITYALVAGDSVMGYTHGTLMANLHALHKGYPIFPVATSDDDFAIALGIRVATRSGAKVITLSSGWPKFGNPDVISDEIKASVSNGTVFVQASGNDSTAIEPLKRYQNESITVGYSVAGNSKGTIGATDITVPMEGNFSQPGTDDVLWTENLKTSGATQVVGAIADMIKEARPCLSPVEVKSIIVTTGDKLLAVGTARQVLANSIVKGGDINPVNAMKKALLKDCAPVAVWHPAEPIWYARLDYPFLQEFKAGCSLAGGFLGSGTLGNDPAGGQVVTCMSAPSTVSPRFPVFVSHN